MPPAPLADAGFRMSLGHRLEEVEVAASRVEEAVAHAGASGDEVDAVGLAVREAVGNAIRHGNRQQGGSTVTLRVTLRDALLEIAVRDEGTGFDPGAVPDPLAPENLLKPSGRGIFLMEKAMDEVSFHFEPDGGTLVTMRRRLEGAQ